MYRLPRGSRNLTADLWRRRLATSESTAQRFTAQDPDVRLMLQVRDDNAGAFEELMLRYQHRFVSLLAHLVGRRDLGEDLAQDVFLRIYRARKRYVPGSKFSTWLYTIATAWSLPQEIIQLTENLMTLSA